MKKRTEITIESERVLVVSGRRRLPVVWCTPCGKHVEVITTDEAAIVSRVTSRTMFRWVESGKVHYSETPEGLLLICRRSLC